MQKKENEESHHSSVDQTTKTGVDSITGMEVEEINEDAQSYAGSL